MLSCSISSPFSLSYFNLIAVIQWFHFITQSYINVPSSGHFTITISQVLSFVHFADTFLLTSPLSVIPKVVLSYTITFLSMFTILPVS